MDKLLNLFKVLSDETRLRILVLLYHKKLCVCQIQGVLKESQPKISKHLGKLRDMGFVRDERKEQFIYYYLDDNNKTLKNLLKEIIDDVEQYPIIKNDLLEIVDAEQYIEAKKKELLSGDRNI
ncbi:metalloregulator ArsR/SmtB family transcription factor [Alkalibaculum sp. M08DMB]|uniref:Metalloregulator ArsR/SmtB family transcription factor n=1 Tax=Alkalibaculum sporogenes TaxID=2655001 RepID=A0A6A7KBS0_9FIRM|nr:metalloregulator ArsR/SmtB family transcription factor [Alkalibaculum sporogenes]MPW26795.1 metalloregulator ArsR/SmtB family transcription factor [Alkalibaculum sporogenes]